MAKPVPMPIPYAQIVPRGTHDDDRFGAGNIPIVQQAPSMQRIMERHPEIAVVATPVTPAAANALQQRAELIAKAVNGKAESGRTSPRKF